MTQKQFGLECKVQWKFPAKQWKKTTLWLHLKCDKTNGKVTQHPPYLRNNFSICVREKNAFNLYIHQPESVKLNTLIYYTYSSNVLCILQLPCKHFGIDYMLVHQELCLITKIINMPCSFLMLNNIHWIWLSRNIPRK